MNFRCCRRDACEGCLENWKTNRLYATNETLQRVISCRWDWRPGASPETVRAPYKIIQFLPHQEQKTWSVVVQWANKQP